MSIVNKAYFSGGCFWCTEAIYKRLKGVLDVKPGYCGGNIQNPTYKEIHKFIQLFKGVEWKEIHVCLNW